MTGLLPRRVLPVLMYHRIGGGDGGDPALWVAPDELERQLAWVAERGLATLDLDRAYEAFRSRRHPRRSVVLTFDDAFAETLVVAAAALGRRGQTAAVFAPSDLLGSSVRLEPAAGGAGRGSEGRIAGAGELRAWAEAGHGVGSHSATHADLTALGPGALRREVEDSKRRLEEVLEAPVLDFCYPYARHDAVARRAVAAAGYRAAWAGEPPRDDLWALPRMMVFPGETEARFRRKLSGFYYWLSAWHRRLAGRRRGRPG